MQPRLFHSRRLERRSRRDSVAFTTSGDRSLSLGVDATSTLRPPLGVGAGVAGGADALGTGISSICLAALSSFSWGNVTFTVTGTQAARAIASVASTTG
jgi:hypothetical protein